MMTHRQHELLSYIANRLASTGVAPSYDEMKDAIGLKSKSGIHRLVTALEERGFIRRLPHRARALEVVRIPPEQEDEQPSDSPSDEFPGIGELVARDALNAAKLPLYGRIAAGTPIEALRDMERKIDIPGDLVTHQGEHYALEIAGDSMRDAGILDGDIAIIRRASVADNGEIVVALIDDLEATLKRLQQRGDTILLEAANPDYETREFGAHQVKVQGKLVGLMRRY